MIMLDHSNALSGHLVQAVIDQMLVLMQGCTAISLAEHTDCANISDMLRRAHAVPHDIDSAKSCNVVNIAARGVDAAVGSLSRLSSMGSLE